MALISSALVKKLEHDPNGRISVIVRVQGNAAAHTLQVQAMGVTIKHAYTLIPGFALQGACSVILKLSKEPWVVSVEEDKQVHTMGK